MIGPVYVLYFICIFLSAGFTYAYEFLFYGEGAQTEVKPQH